MHISHTVLKSEILNEIDDANKCLEVIKLLISLHAGFTCCEQCTYYTTILFTYLTEKID